MSEQILTEQRPPAASAAAAVGVADVPVSFNITAAERETGIAKDTLRVWERRYGFPKPERDAIGDRRYGAEDLRRLRLLKQLIDLGHRSGKVVPLLPERLQLLLRQSVALAGSHGPVAQVPRRAIEECLAVIRGSDIEALRQRLDSLRVELGLGPFVQELVAPLTTRVGEAWMQGEIGVHQEHLYTAAVSGVLAVAIRASTTAQPPSAPRVITTTVPGEPHGLGLLMVQAMLALERVDCVPLGVQTPLDAIVQAAAGCRADVVALSFSAWLPMPAVLSALELLRQQLPRDVQLLAGGSSAALHRCKLGGVRVMHTLAELSVALREWREQGAPAPRGSIRAMGS